MFDSNHLHIAIASDENYARFVATLIVSTAKHNSNFKTISFHLLANGISSTTLSKLGKAVDRYKNCRLEIHDISNLAERLGIAVPATIALTSYARLFMADIISDEISRILYLDTDIIVNDDLSELWTTRLNDNYVGGCLDVFEGTESKTAVGLNADAPYVNTGVLLINLDEWRKNNLSGKFMDFLFQHNGKVHHHDQGIINGVCKGHLLLLPPQYNMHSTVYSHPYWLIKKITIPYYSQEEYDNAIASPAIIHYTEGFYNRPWKKNCKHPMRQLFIAAQNETPWIDFPLQSDTRSIAVKLLSFTFLNFPYSIFKILSCTIGLIAVKKR